MKCNSCQEHISPKMKKAVEKNLCPFCGEKIIPDELRKSLIALDSTLEFLLQKFEAETFDYLKDKYSLVTKTSHPIKQANSKRQEIDDDNDENDEEVDEKDLTLTEKLKDKDFRKKYMLASKISGKAAISNNDYEAIISPGSEIPDEPRRKSRDEDPIDDGVDDSIMRKLQSLANQKAGGNPKTSDLEKLEAMMAKTKKPFSPPC